MTDAADRIVWESDEEALYRAAHAQISTETDARAEEGSTPTDAAMARPAFDRADNTARLALEVAALKRERERLTEDLRIEVDLHEEMTARWVAVREGIKALADEWTEASQREQEFADRHQGYYLGVVGTRRNCRDHLLTLLAPSPAATTGEAVSQSEAMHLENRARAAETRQEMAEEALAKVTAFGDALAKAIVRDQGDAAYAAIVAEFHDEGSDDESGHVEQREWLPAPVSPGEAGTGEDHYATQDRIERELREDLSAPVSSGEAGTGEAVQS